MTFLKPCPFCGSEATLCGQKIPSQSVFFDSYYWVECSSCKIQTELFGHKEDAIEGWNKRVEE